MKLLTRNTDYAVRAVCYMAKRRDGLVSVPELVKALKIPRPFLRKILQILNKEGIVRSYRGIGGGFRLVIKPEKLKVVDIIEAFQGRLSLNECKFKKLICPGRKTCPLKKRIDGIERYVVSKLGAITIGELIK